MSEGADIPLQARVALAHAAVQRLAEGCGVDLLHIKGPAVDPSLRGRPRTGSDVDVIVRPSGVGRLMTALAEHGWRTETTFDAGSAFDHAANLYHPDWGLLDVHRHYPGMDRDPTAVFALLWDERVHADIAHVPCPVPEPIAQSLVLLLHAARSRAVAEHPDVAPNWDDRTEAERAAILDLADRTGARIALAAATGELAAYAGHADAALWEVFTTGGDRLDEWSARWRAARGTRAKASVAVRSLAVNRYYLGQRLGHEPSRPEVATEFFRRLAAGCRAVGGRLRRRVRR
ncbi:nucleotidyltransferase family protein [Phycicoccus sp. CSK15P-2]|uniref:nucleotidyltransferase family protein n=1 Tax=Phycicoccus sp. CSK15P-2 TaxID=2807627 RepID=UPI0019526195|nr:nucleotidyltransferase family protein [Phycicoccus sp. CSK15P-2]MBM6404323.1 nucleotidyltransferase family protein [Phycicoccus sp. CSK15P-2]